MRYQEIREAFPECGIAICDDGVSLIFPAYEPERWVSASISDEEHLQNAQVFCDLLGFCDTVSIVLDPGNCVRFSFDMVLPSDSDAVFAPMRRSLSPEELRRKTMELIAGKKPFPEVLEVFDGVDFSDDYEVMDGILELERIRERHAMISLPGILHWDALYDTASAGFLRSARLGSVSVEPPDGALDFGTIEFYMESKAPAVFQIRREEMKDFRKLVSMAGGVSLSAMVEPGFSNFVLDVSS